MLTLTMYVPEVSMDLNSGNDDDGVFIGLFGLGKLSKVDWSG